MSNKVCLPCQKGSTLKWENLLHEKQILDFHSGPLFFKGTLNTGKQTGIGPEKSTWPLSLMSASCWKTSKNFDLKLLYICSCRISKNSKNFPALNKVIDSAFSAKNIRNCTKCIHSPECKQRLLTEPAPEMTTKGYA